jgi:hypothetical protein
MLFRPVVSVFPIFFARNRNALSPFQRLAIFFAKPYVGFELFYLRVSVAQRILCFANLFHENLLLAVAWFHPSSAAMEVRGWRECRDSIRRIPEIDAAPVVILVGGWIEFRIGWIDARHGMNGGVKRRL